MSNADKRRLLALRDDRKAREAAGLVLLEGAKVIGEVGRTTRLEELFVADDADGHSNAAVQAMQLLPPKRVVRVPRRWLTGISSFVTSDREPAMATAGMPQPQALTPFQWVLVLDRINDPGNLGTLVRTAAGLGWQGVYFVQPACDPFHAKVASAARGSLFTLPYDRGDMERLRRTVLQSRQVWVASATDAAPPKQAALAVSSAQALILGNESDGVHSDLRALGTHISLPMAAGLGARSLNVAVAGGILMYTLRHLRRLP